MSIKIYGASLSPYVRKVRLALAFKNLDYELIPVIPMSGDQPEEFKANSPLKKIPLANIDGNWIADSSVILAYLERARPETPLLSKDHGVAARQLWFEEYADSHMTAAIGGHFFFELLLAPVFFGREPNMEEVELARNEEIPAIFDYLESQLTEDYLAGGAMSHADICLCSIFVNMHYCDYRCDAARWPKTAAYIDRVTGSDLFTSVLEDEKSLLGLVGK